MGLLLLGACSPTFNWRDLRPNGTPLQALMPCKPELVERTVPLAGAPTRMHMHNCEAGGRTFVVAWADVTGEARVPEILAGWRAGSLAAIRVDPATASDVNTEWPVQVKGAQHLLGLQATGQDPQGKTTQIRGAYFAKGTQVFQAAVYGPTLPDEALTPFFEGLRLP
ncbi:hypothetical protein [Hydrogenophaga sp.]|uniref:hypothetical protein n=1 Tax=Hydrogenophaga sp. TaxID=1904254 RepID=UPI00272246FD|nr:hypothetical protein [Hydrogenophaga sp.]MDO8903766.1 hypothetical protein [Hydrogenophaga sp.]